MGDLATKRLFRRLWISPAVRDQIRIHKAAAHPELSKLVKELAYDGTNPMKSSPNGLYAHEVNESYYGDIGATLPRDTSTSQDGNQPKKAVAASGKRGWIHQRVLKDQHRHMLRFGDEDLSSTKLMGNKLFKSMLDTPDQYQYILHYLAPDLVYVASKSSLQFHFLVFIPLILMLMGVYFGAQRLPKDVYANSRQYLAP